MGAQLNDQFTQETALNWSVSLYPQAMDPKRGMARLRFRDYQDVLANHRQAEILMDANDIPEALSNAMFEESMPNEMFAFKRRGCLQPHGILQSRQPPEEADLRWGTSPLARRLLTAAESLPTISDVRLRDLIARFGTPRPYGSRGLYAMR